VASQQNSEHSHDEVGHSHGISAGADQRYLIGALVLLLVYMAAEVVVAFLTGSLALLSDAGHMLTDAGAIGVALWAMRLAARPARDAWTFGWKRAEILSALANGVTMAAFAAVIAVEAIRRLVDGHPHIQAGPVLVLALIGIVVNIAVAWLLARANRSSLNVEGAYQHIITDLYGFIGTVVAAIIILTTGWMKADAIASLVVVALMAHAAWGLLRESGRVLLEVAPAGTSIDEIRRHLLEVDHVRDVHDLHVWTVTSDLPSLSAHLVVDDDCFNDGHAPQILDEVQECLGGHFDVSHSTFQLEPRSHAEHEEGAHA
jgi:cobalt-zinc-cadmium efflux system protein